MAWLLALSPTPFLSKIAKIKKGGEIVAIMKRAGWRIEGRSRPGKGKSTPRRAQQAIARIQAAVRKMQPRSGVFSCLDLPVKTLE
jgi:hypothetical protein